MQSVRYGFKQILAVVLTESLVLSMAPPPSQAAAAAAHVALAPWHLTRSSQPKVNSASLTISLESKNSFGPRGVGTGDSEKETVVPVVAANPAKPSTTDIEAKSIVKPSHLGGATTPGARPLAFIENKGQFNDRVKFQVPGNGHTLWLTDSGIVFDFARAKSTQTTKQLLEVQPAKVDPKTVSVGESSRLEKSAIREAERHVIYQDFVGTNRGFTIETKGAQRGAYNYIAVSAT